MSIVYRKTPQKILKISITTTILHEKKNIYIYIWIWHDNCCVNCKRAAESLKALKTCCCSSSGRWKLSWRIRSLLSNDLHNFLHNFLSVSLRHFRSIVAKMCAKNCSSKIRFKSDILMVPVLPVSNAMKASRTCALVASKLQNIQNEVVQFWDDQVVKLHVNYWCFNDKLIQFH